MHPHLHTRDNIGTVLPSYARQQANASQLAKRSWQCSTNVTLEAFCGKQLACATMLRRRSTSVYGHRGLSERKQIEKLQRRRAKGSGRNGQRLMPIRDIVVRTEIQALVERIHYGVLDGYTWKLSGLEILRALKTSGTDIPDCVQYVEIARSPVYSYSRFNGQIVSIILAILWVESVSSNPALSKRLANPKLKENLNSQHDSTSTTALKQHIISFIHCSKAMVIRIGATSGACRRSLSLAISISSSGKICKEGFPDGLVNLWPKGTTEYMNG